MARKKTDGAPSPVSNSTEKLSRPSSPDRPAGPLSVTVSPDTRFEVKVNNANVTELKIACDDALKRHLSRAELFRQNHQHTDVRLALGWASVFVAGGTGLYGYKIEFEQAKPVLWLGVIAYLVLTFAQTLYAYFVEGSIIFVGKRKTSSKRIVNERIVVASSSLPVSGSKAPAYELSVNYVRSTNGGKSLLAKGKVKSSKEYNAFFDEAGIMDQDRFELWVGEVVEQAMEGKSS